MHSMFSRATISAALADKMAMPDVDIAARR
jgi:hypothetical protein